MTPQLWEFVDAKLRRIRQSLYGDFNIAVWNYRQDPSRVLELRALEQSMDSFKKARTELKYEYLGLKDSWL